MISDEAKTFHLRSVLSLPVAADRHLFGALNLYASDMGTFDAASTHQPGAAIAHQGVITLRYPQLLQAEQAARAREHAVAALVVQIPSSTVRISR